MNERLFAKAASPRAGPDRVQAAPTPRRQAASPRRHELHALEGARRGGVSVPHAGRAALERRLGADLSAVRLHRGPDADALAGALDATAFTSGADVFLHRSAPDVATPAGQVLLAHELVHVIQQSAGPVDGAPGPLGLLVSHPGDRHERAAARVVAGRERPPDLGGPIRRRSGLLVVQRQGPLGVAPVGPLLTPPTPPVVPPAAVPVDGFTVPWAGTAATTGESIAVRLGLQGARVVGQGLVTAGGAALGEGAIVAGTGAALTEGAAVVTGAVITEGAIAAGATVAAPTAVVVAAESAAVLGTATVATEATLAAGAATTGAALITPVGWVVIGVVVVAIGVGIAVYLITRETPAPEEIVPVERVAGATRGTGKGSMAPVRAPGRPGSAVREPEPRQPLVAPAKGGMAPVREPEERAPAVAPGAGPATPMELGARTEVHVYHRLTGKEITDIDEIGEYEGMPALWEWKEAVNASDISEWVRVNIRGKFYAYKEARNHPPLYPHYKDAAIGFAFDYELVLEFGEAVWNEIDLLRAENPDVTIPDPVIGAVRGTL